MSNSSVDWNEISFDSSTGMHTGTQAHRHTDTHTDGLIREWNLFACRALFLTIMKIRMKKIDLFYLMARNLIKNSILSIISNSLPTARSFPTKYFNRIFVLTPRIQVTGCLDYTTHQEEPGSGKAFQ